MNNPLIKPVAPVDVRTMDLQEQFKRCETWNNAEQWEFLAMAYYARGYLLNALHCFKRADACRLPVAHSIAVETEG